MGIDNKPKIENPLKNGLRQRPVLGLSKEWLSGETSEPHPLVTGIFHVRGRTYNHCR